MPQEPRIKMYVLFCWPAFLLFVLSVKCASVFANFNLELESHLDLGSQVLYHLLITYKTTQ